MRIDPVDRGVGHLASQRPPFLRGGTAVSGCADWNVHSAPTCVDKGHAGWFLVTDDTSR